MIAGLGKVSLVTLNRWHLLCLQSLSSGSGDPGFMGIAFCEEKPRIL
jgi:hypothetical protein